MFRILYFILLLLLTKDVLAQTPVRIKDPKREVRFIDLTKEENASFFRRNRELPKLIMDAMLGIRNVIVDAYVGQTQR